MTDTERLDWLQSNYKPIRLIEPPDALPSKEWVAFDDEDGGLMARGKTFRDLIDELISAVQSPETPAGIPTEGAQGGKA